MYYALVCFCLSFTKYQMSQILNVVDIFLGQRTIDLNLVDICHGTIIVSEPKKKQIQYLWVHDSEQQTMIQQIKKACTELYFPLDGTVVSIYFTKNCKTTTILPMRGWDDYSYKYFIRLFSNPSPIL